MGRWGWAALVVLGVALVVVGQVSHAPTLTVGLLCALAGVVLGVVRLVRSLRR